MSTPSELEKAEHEVRDLEYRTAGVKDKISFLDKELVLLALKELSLQDNIINLKKNSLIVLIAEYSRSKEDLARTKVRLIEVRKQKLELDGALKTTLKFLGKAKLKLDAILKNKENNVLEGKFGNQNDQ